MQCECGGYYSVVTTRQVTCDRCDGGRAIQDYRDQEDRLAREVTEAPENQLTNILQIFSTNIALHPTHYVYGILIGVIFSLLHLSYYDTLKKTFIVRKSLSK